MELDGTEKGPELSQFPATLRQRREAAGFTQKALGERCGLAGETIRRIEGGRKRATVSTMRRLLAVPELKLDAESVLPPVQPHPRAEALNWWVAPHLDAVSMLQELRLRLAAPGGRIEQTYMYLDHQSALDWCKIANDPSYLAEYRQPLPLEHIAGLALEVIGQGPIDVAALGPGDGQQETRFVQALVSRQLERDLRFHLLDISQPLLSKAHRHAKDCLDTVRGVTVVGMFGNFHFLPLYEQIFYSPAKRRRIFTLLGATMNNLDDEARFFRDSLRCAGRDDLLLVDFTIAVAPASQPARVQEIDLPLRQPMPELVLNWLGGPFHRNGKPRQVQGAYHLVLDCPVPGSYSLDAKLKVFEETGWEREFVVWRVKRYDPEQLTAWLEALGWKRLYFTRFGPSTRNQMGVMLLRKDG
jgi:transcriptional regulator with XRE-family HTH domain